MMQTEIEESNRHSREFWKVFAHAIPGGEAFERDGLSIANAKQPWFFLNLGMLNRPIADQSDLRYRAQEAFDHFEPGNKPWALAASEDWFGPNATWVLSSVGLAHKLDLTGMLAEHLGPPIRPLPQAQLRRIEDEQTRFALADLNAEGYGVPREWARQALGSEALWQKPLFGIIASIGSEPVSGAFALPIDDALYIGWVATSKSHRGMGLAELVIRACLEDARKATGLERTILHATDAGLPVYTRMGYRTVVKFPFYSPETLTSLESVDDSEVRSCSYSI